ncbi:response regulator [Thiohalocapsa sp.]|uniref:response regulator n=1 Tax=Thiohalocapsa sp. TaxID=2497641 RepID=UPI0025D78F12|nr:response regulator [Thiohalocapsa sp.]
MPALTDNNPKFARNPAASPTERSGQLSIGFYVLGACLLIVVLGATMSALNLWTLRGVNAGLTDVVEVKAEALKLAARLNRRIAELRVITNSLLLDERQNVVDWHGGAMHTVEEAVGTDLKALERLPLSPAARRLTAAFASAYADYLPHLERVIGLVRDGDRVAAADLSRSTLQERGVRVQGVLEQLVHLKESELSAAKADADRAYTRALYMTLGAIGFTLAMGALAAFLLWRLITRNLARLVRVTEAIAKGDLEREPERLETAELQRLAASVRVMQHALRESHNQTRASDWLKTALGRLSERMSGDPDLATLAAGVISEIATTVDAAVGACYIEDDRQSRALRLVGSYAYRERKHLANRFAPGEGLVGQCALEHTPILLTEVPDDYIKISSGLGEATPRTIRVTPLLRDERLVGVIELGFVQRPAALVLSYLDQAMPAVAVAVESARARADLADALTESQQLTEELTAQQEELRAANEELEEQTERLKASEARLQTQQEELQASNEELEEKNEALQRQQREIAEANAGLARQREALAEKARELETASKYKSEFLSNMSHELRTPLNSLLLLAASLAENATANLTDEQVESARIIERSGQDLLGLINEILDLARIEAGRTELKPETVVLAEVAQVLDDTFRPLATDRGLELQVGIEPTAPEQIFADRRRLEQVLRNFLSNAIKFTDKGSVTLCFGRPDPALDLRRSGLDPAATLAVSVTDTGIGIPAEEQSVIFEAFQQIDAGTARRYGGTGLGLSISRNLAELMGGEIQLSSEPAQGSCFTLFVPLTSPEPATTPDADGASRQPSAAQAAGLEQTMAPPAAAPAPPPEAAHAGVADDRAAIADGDTTVLLVEDDARFAKLLIDQCHRRGFKALMAGSGEEGLRLAAAHAPQAVILDIRLPGMDGWAVLERLKDNPETRHIPVHVMSVDEGPSDVLHRGAVGFLQKPVAREALEAAFQRLEHVFSRAVKDLLVVEDETVLRHEMVHLMASDDVRVAEAGTGAEAIARLEQQRFDCMVLDLGLPDMTGLELLRRLSRKTGIAVPPVVVYTGRELTREEDLELRNYSDSIIVKGARSRERLLDETSLFLHRMVGGMPERARRMITDLHDPDRFFKDRRVLLVDDDMRNVFALSKILEAKGLTVVKAEDGQHALDVLAGEHGIELVLMDIMMPGMDGYETMRRIRARPELAHLPIIALTAKAMKEDNERCIAAGADDYLSKPVNLERLLSMLRVWLYR